MKMKKIDEKVKKTEKTNIDEALLMELKKDKIRTRGRVFEGIVIRKFHKRVVIEFERMVYIRKYERYAKSRTKIHARLPVAMQDQINIGDRIKVQECRPLSKLVHFVVIQKIKSRGNKK